MSAVIKGRTWKFGDNVNTDVMAPGFAMGYPWEELRKVVLHIHEAFTENVKRGDVIVAARNWGCGSSRENAPANLKRLGLGCVVAESFGRIYFRNSIALAFPAIVCPGITEHFDEGDELQLELETARITNLTTSESLQGEPWSADMLEILSKGGIVAALRERLRAREVD